MASIGHIVVVAWLFLAALIHCRHVSWGLADQREDLDERLRDGAIDPKEHRFRIRILPVTWVIAFLWLAIPIIGLGLAGFWR